MGVIENKESLKAISIEELEEQAQEVDFLTPRELAKLLAVHPQQIYTWIRKSVFPAERCKCGRTVVCVSIAREALRKRDRSLGKIIDTSLDPKHVPEEEPDDLELETSDLVDKSEY